MWDIIPNFSGVFPSGGKISSPPTFFPQDPTGTLVNNNPWFFRRGWSRWSVKLTTLLQVTNLGIHGVVPPPICLHGVMPCTSRQKSDFMTEFQPTTHDKAVSLIAASQHNKIQNTYAFNSKADIRNRVKDAKKAVWHVRPNLHQTQSGLWNGYCHIAAQMNDS